MFVISDVGMVILGNYCNFYYKGGKKYVYIIDLCIGYLV